MEIAVLILVNLLTGIVLYFFFSLRFSSAVEKAQKNSGKALIKELRSNIENTIRYMDDSIELIDKKVNTFYQMLRHAEGLVAKLEALNAEEDGRKKKRSPRVKAKKDEVVTRSESETLFAAVPEIKSGSDDEEERSTDEHLMRVLSRTQGDSFEPSFSEHSSVDSLYRSGEASAGKRKDDEQSRKGVVEKVGSVLGAFLGIGPNRAKELFVDSAPRNEGGSTSEEGQKAQSLPPFSGVLQESVAAVHSPRQESRQADEAPVDLFVGADRTLSEFIADYEAGLYGNRRNDFIRLLTRHGFSAVEIAREMKISPAEVELIAVIPETQNRPRKNRISSSL